MTRLWRAEHVPTALVRKTDLNQPMSPVTDARFDALYADAARADVSGDRACVRECSVLLCWGSDTWKYPEATWTRPNWMALWALGPGGAVTSCGQRFALAPARLVVIPPGAVYGTDCQQPFRCVLISFATLGFHPLPHLSVTAIEDASLLTQAAAVVACLGPKPPTDPSLTVLALAYAVLSRMPPLFDRRQRLPRHIRQALEYVERHPNYSTGNQELAALVHMQRTAFIRAFHRAVGTPPQTYFRRQRIEEACRRLLDPDSRIADVAREMGFADPSYFCRVFRLALGTTPAQWQRDALRLPPR
jgi:AraC-like DNA-binding protein